MKKFYSETFKTQMVQVSKKVARKLFNAGKVIYLHPCNVSFDNVWQAPIAIRLNGTFASSSIPEFDNAVNHFVYYNCDGERGRYPHYYIQQQ